MTPGALARLSAESHQRLVEAATALARQAGVTDELDALLAYTPTQKQLANPKAVMMRERDLITALLLAISARLHEEDDPDVTPPPSRANRPARKAA